MSPAEKAPPARLVLDGPLPPAANMARDEALLSTARASGGTALRFYRWRPWAFSLGYFQKFSDFDRYLNEGYPVVRRLTGGGAIFHADELTYSLVGPFGKPPFPRRAADIFESVHRALAAGLARAGVEAQVSDGPAGASPTICFSAPQRFDLVAGGRKLLGSAQRRRGGAFLQHGSLPLSPNRFQPEAVSAEELLGGRPEPDALAAALWDAIEGAFGLSFEHSQLTSEEERLAKRLEVGKYATPEWNARR